MIKFFNIRSKEVRVAETEPQIAALWSSSDHSPNITQGQDFGWRLAPEVVVEMKRIKQDYPRLVDIARSIQKNIDEITEPDILMHIAMTNAQAQLAVATDEDYTDEYNAQIRKLEIEAEAATAQSVTTTTTESLADFERRVELEERMAAAKAKNAELESQTTTTTTTVLPKATTTTTEK